MRIFASMGLSLILAAPASAGSPACSPVDLQDLLGPPLNQGDSGYCFAHTSATLIHARLGVAASPMQLATHYLLTTPQELESANVDPQVHAELTPEFFARWHTDRTVEPGNYSPDKILSDDGLLNTGGDEAATLVAANVFGLCAEARLPTGKKVYRAYLHAIRAFHGARMKGGFMPGESELPIGEIQDPDSRAKAWSFRLWVEERCGTTIPASQPLLPESMSLAKNLKAFRLRQRLQQAADWQENQNRVMDIVNRQLDRGNPVAVGYALSDLMPADKQMEAGADAPAPEDHASVFAGRRMRGGRCYYYLRTS
ncbi:MAG: hypothetical protein ACXWSC_15870, partial [Bdellovibrionota bacterium]